MPAIRHVELHPTEDPYTILATVEMGAVDRDRRARRLARPSAPTRTVPSPTSASATRTPWSASTMSPPSTCSTLGRRVPDVNLEIVEPGPGADAVTMRVHERGAGITEACGTGAVAAAWAASRWGFVGAGADGTGGAHGRRQRESGARPTRSPGTPR